MPQLPRRAHRIDSRSDEMARESVTQIMEAELRHTIVVQPSGIGRLVEAALGDVVAVERPSCGGGEDIRIRARKARRELGGLQVVSEVRLELACERDISPARPSLEVDAAGGIACEPRLSWARTWMTPSRKSMSPQTRPRTSWILIPV